MEDNLKTALQNLTANQKSRIDTAYSNLAGYPSDGTASEKADFIVDSWIRHIKSEVKSLERRKALQDHRDNLTELNI